MPDPPSNEPHATPRLRVVGTLLSSLLILGTAAGLLWLVFTTEPKAVRVGASKKTAMLVQVTAAERGEFRPVIEAMGTVRPSQDIVLEPQVAGAIVEIGEGFAPGGFVEKGERLVRIEPADYRDALAQRRAALRQAQSELDLEMGHQAVARESHARLEKPLSPDQEALVLRQPQRAVLEAKVAAAQAAVAKARRDLARTTITAPFDAHILDRHVHVGSQVSPGDRLARLVGWRSYWVEVTVPLAKVRWLTFLETGAASAVEIRHRSRPGRPVCTARHACTLSWARLRRRRAWRACSPWWMTHSPIHQR